MKQLKDLRKELFANAVIKLKNKQVLRMTRGALIKLFEKKPEDEKLKFKVKGMTAYIWEQ